MQAFDLSNVIVILAAIIVILLVYVAYLKRSVGLEVEKRVLEREDLIRKDALDRSRASLKGRLSEQIVPFLEQFHYNPADARFIGSPIDFVIFDGYTDVKDGGADKPIGVVLMEIKKGRYASLSQEERRIEEGVKKGMVKWETIHLQ